MLYDEEDRVVGVRTGDKGIDKEGKQKANFEPGVDLRAKVTVLGEGPRGSLTKQLVQRLGLDEGREPQVYSIGVKELWELPDDRYPTGRVTHTLGYPSDSKTYGGGWIYGMQNRILNIGYVTGLDYQDPLLDPHAEFQRFKQHPYHHQASRRRKDDSLWREDYRGGRLFCNAANLCRWRVVGRRLRGLSQFTASEGNSLRDQKRNAGGRGNIRSAGGRRLLSKSVAALRATGNESWIIPELRKVRNFHAGFKHGRWLGMVNTGFQFITGGRSWGLFDRAKAEGGHEAMRKLSAYGYRGDDIEQRYGALKFDGKVAFNKLTDVYHAAVGHSEDQPSHLHVLDTNICATRCAEEYGNPCQRFCPAAVYEMVDDGTNGKRKLQINFSNCVHCKTCDIMDPYQIINWVTPEGGGGPDYKGM